MNSKVNDMIKQDLDFLFGKTDCPVFDDLMKYAEGNGDDNFSYKIEMHLNDCDFCSSVVNSVSSDLNLEKIKVSSNKVIEKISNQNTESGYQKSLSDKIFDKIIFKFNLKTTAFASVFLVLTLFFTTSFFEPEYYDMAKLNEQEIEMILVSGSNQRGNEDLLSPELNISELLAAEKNRFGILPYFDQTKVKNLLPKLIDEFNSTNEIFYKEKYAYFIGKIHLMLNDKEAAIKWFNIVTAINSKTLYSRFAENILNQLN